METAVALSPIFFPEDSTFVDCELAGLLARLTFCGLPVPFKTVAEVAKSYSEAYSCGYSSGISPDSLFRLTSKLRKLVNQYAAKVKNYPFIMSRIIGFNPLKKNSTAITMTINPIRRIITLIPVCPSILSMRDEL